MPWAAARKLLQQLSQSRDGGRLLFFVALDALLFLGVLLTGIATRHASLSLVLCLVPACRPSSSPHSAPWFRTPPRRRRLTLVSDAFHLCFGCAVLTVALLAKASSRQEPNAAYTFGRAPASRPWQLSDALAVRTRAPGVALLQHPQRHAQRLPRPRFVVALAAVRRDSGTRQQHATVARIRGAQQRHMPAAVLWPRW